MSEKATGYTLLIVGIVIMLFCAGSMILVFTKRAEPIQLFHFNALSIDSSKLAPQMPDLSGVPGVKAPQEATVAKPLEILPADMLNTSSNIFAHLALMGFLLSVGSKVAGLGVDLLRPIIVKTPKTMLPTE